MSKRRKKENTANDQETNSSWVDKFSERPENRFFCRVEKEYYTDEFNLCGLNRMFPDYYSLMTIISSVNQESFVLNEDAGALYGQIHVRFIKTKAGLIAMFRKYQRGDFGQCPILGCENTNLLPIGLSTQPFVSKVKVYCPRCRQVQNPADHLIAYKMDGSCIGPDMPFLLIMMYPEVINFDEKNRFCFIPRIYGFRLHKEFWNELKKRNKAAKEVKRSSLTLLP